MKLPSINNLFLFKITFNIFLTISFFQCNPFASNKDSSEKSATLLALAISSNIAQSSTPNCPPSTLPQDILIADEIISAPGASDRAFGDPSKAINGICGGGENNGSLDVYELEATGSGSSLILSWKNKRVLNSTGIDFIVFENSFKSQGTSNLYFIEPIVVDVSEDNVNFCGFTPNFSGGGTATQLRDDWKNFAGLSPVFYNMTNLTLTAAEIFSDPTQQSSGFSYYMGKSGGDGFDLNSSSFGSGCAVGVRDAIRTNGFVYLRLRSSQSQSFPAPVGVFRQSSDIDGVIAKSTASR
jgi:hypothetical protein